MISPYETKKEKFGEEIINANINNITLAMNRLTDVEFRMWIENCKIYPNFHPSHFEGLEESFIKTGKWEFTKVDLSRGEASKNASEN